MDVSQEYSEPDDFKEHRQHIDAMDQALGSVEIPSAARVLDVGGGQGMHACFLAQRYTLCYCLDIIDYQSLYNGEFPRLFREKCARNGVDFEETQLKFIKSDAMDMLFRDEYFDFVTSFNALEHIPDPIKALEEMVRVTRRGGIIYVTFDPIWTADTGSHFIHRVPDPWAHLVDSQDEFVGKMRDAGASEDEMSDFRSGMNQLRLSQHRENIGRIVARKDVQLLHELTWSGLADAAYKNHPNYRKCIKLGYSREELNMRGMQYIFRKI
jgi:ubiquinone/menaquinone biosynthesis C-methylase UbiE